MLKKLITSAAGLILVAPLQADDRPPKPNVIIALIDDLGWQDVKCYDIDGPSPYETPNIDALAKRGVMFWEAYSPAPTCSPSRGAIMAGKYPARLQRTHVKGGQPPAAKNKTKDVMIDPWHMGRLDVSETTIAEALKANGYRTGHSGKWHIAIDHNAFPQPKDHGFDVTYSGRGANNKMSPDRLSDFATADAKDPYQLDEEGFPKDSVTLNAIDFMENAKAQPFFLYYPTWLVHYPVQTRSRALLEKYCKKLGVEMPTDPEGWPLEGQKNPYYCAMVEMVDHYIGQLVSYLETTDDARWPGHKLIENTYIIFSSDNGGAEGGHGEIYTDNAPLTDGKGSTLEGGTRVPLIIAGPGIKEGIQTNVMANGVDFFPTILSWANLKLPAGMKVDGCDLSALVSTDPQDAGLVKDASGDSRKTMIHHFPHGVKARSTIRRDGFKLIYTYNHYSKSKSPEIELYQLYDDEGNRVDIEETKDLAKEMPEKAAALKKELMAALDEMDASKPYLNPFFEGKLPGKEKVCTPVEETKEGNTVTLTYKENGAKVQKAFLFYTTTLGDKAEEWFRKPITVEGNGKVSCELPEGTNGHLITLVDENNFLVKYPDNDPGK